MLVAEGVGGRGGEVELRGGGGHGLRVRSFFARINGVVGEVCSVVGNEKVLVERVCCVVGVKGGGGIYNK